MRALAFTALLIAVLLLVFVWLRPEPAWEPFDASESGPTPGAVASPELRGELLDPPLRASVGPETSDAQPAATETELEAQSASVRLSGRWTVVAPDGSEHTNSDGRFVLRLYEPRTDFDVDVVSGTWSLDLPADARFDLLQLELGQRPTAATDDVGNIGIPESRELHLRARWIAPVVLTVIDAETHVELDGLTIVRGASGTRWVHPGSITSVQAAFNESRLWLQDQRSPVTLPIDDDYRDRQAVFARAPGYAWGMIVVPTSVGGDYLLALSGAGDLEVEVIGAPPELALQLRLRTTADPDDYEGVRFEAALGDRTHVAFESLATGDYIATVELGHRYRTPQILAQAAVTIEAGRRTNAVLDVSGFEAPQLTTLSGRLHVPPEWELSSFGLFATLIGQSAIDSKPQRYLNHAELRVVEHANGEHAFTFADVQPGKWELRFNPLGTSLAVEVPPEGLHDVRLDVPLPATVRVDVRDEDTGDPVTDIDVHWMPDRSELESGGVLNGAGRTSDGSFRFRTPAGRVEVWCMGARWSFRRHVADVQPGDNELRIGTVLACGVVLSVRDDDTLLRVDDFIPRVVALDGDERGDLVDEDVPGLEQRFRVPAAGRYRVELTAPAGYRSIPAMELTIPAKTYVEHVVEVERE